MLLVFPAQAQFQYPAPGRAARRAAARPLHLVGWDEKKKMISELIVEFTGTIFTPDLCKRLVDIVTDNGVHK
jgi:hypothetical protein